jgi:hypothetical protein
LSGDNWRSTIQDSTSVSGVLAGFAIAFVGLILQSHEDLTLITIAYGGSSFGISANSVALLVSGLSAALFIGSLEFSLAAKRFDVWSLPKDYETFLQRDSGWPQSRNRQDKLCVKYADLGRRLYNIAIFTIFLALGLTILPYSLLVGVATTAIGWIVEVAQIVTFRSR